MAMDRDKIKKLELLVSKTLHQLDEVQKNSDALLKPLEEETDAKSIAQEKILIGSDSVQPLINILKNGTELLNLAGNTTYLTEDTKLLEGAEAFYESASKVSGKIQRDLMNLQSLQTNMIKILNGRVSENKAKKMDMELLEITKIDPIATSSPMKHN